MASTDSGWLRHTYHLAAASVEAGDQPFAAVVVDASGRARVPRVNERVRSNDSTAHAELLACRFVAKHYSRTFLAACTLYSSTEPCLMCAGAIAWSGIGRLVFGVSARSMNALAPPGFVPRFPDPWPAAELLARAAPPVLVEGPLLEQEGLVAHVRAWELLGARPAPLSPSAD